MHAGILAILAAIPLVGLGALGVTTMMVAPAPDGMQGCDMGGMMGGMAGMMDGVTDGMLQECNAMMAECMAHHQSECDMPMAHEECGAMMEQ